MINACNESFAVKTSITGFLSCLEASGLKADDIDKLALEAEFKKRNSGKIVPSEFLALIVIAAVKGLTSFNDLAISFDSLAGISISRQAVQQRFTSELQALTEKILQHVLSNHAKKQSTTSEYRSLPFKRILIQDSTIIQLPERLFETFSGVSNGKSQVCNARIQAVYDAISGKFLSFSIDPYCKNDLVAAPELQLEKGDLALRDRGYLLYDEIARHIQVGADCIYRHKHKLIYLNPETNEPINLLAELTENGTLDMVVCLNNPERTLVRLVAAPVRDEIANIRKMKLKKEAKGHNPSAENLALQAWTIFITTISAERADFNQIFKTYSLRWRIETIFKSWKSNAKFAQIHNVSQIQLRILITARLIMIAVTMKCIFTPASQMIKDKLRRELSIIKLMRYVCCSMTNICSILEAIREKETSHAGFKPLLNYCLYDKRKRRNFNEELLDILEDWTLA